ncbi:MAG: alpha-ketoglutarate-dependent dioxygenase AlkB, partial [Cohaesibacteraceae bacterium]|nr:alpha-ketoglutarate-dependent dioxygenase AlkB [Cohaesibacteraceae bacterium]
MAPSRFKGVYKSTNATPQEKERYVFTNSHVFWFKNRDDYPTNNFPDPIRKQITIKHLLIEWVSATIFLIKSIFVEIQRTIGLNYFPGFLSRPDQNVLVDILRQITSAAPLYTPQMPKSGKPFSVRMTNCGELGWVSDKKLGYRYQPKHPVTNQNWPQIPPMLLSIWDELANYPHAPEACLINYYGADAKMGLHQDRDEQDIAAPVLSISLGDTARFRIGGLNRKDPTKSFPLVSGDVLMLAGESRLAFHGIDRILTGTSTLLKSGGRINITMRR